MRKLIFAIATLSMSLSLHAQVQNIPASIYVDESIPAEARNLLTSKLTSILAANGINSNADFGRIILFARTEITQNDIVPSTPPKVSKKLTAYLTIGDVYENQIFSTCSLDLSGIGATDNKAFASAFSTIKPANPVIKDFLAVAKSKMESFYEENSNAISIGIKALVKAKEYDQAINRIISIPCFNPEAIESYRNEAIGVYQTKIDDSSLAALISAKAEWTRSKDKDGASAALAYIKQVDPASSAYADALILWDEISAKLSKDEQEAKDFARKQYEDKQAFKASILKLIENVGTAFCYNRPKEITRIVKGWW